MSQEEFRKQLKIAADWVDSWPLWKQNILENSAKPTVDVPRVPVDNNRTSEPSERPSAADQGPPPPVKP